MSAGTSEQRSGCGPRLVWIAKAVFTFLLVIGVLVAIVWGGFMIYQMVQTEIDRSSTSVTTRFDAQESRIDILREEVNTLVAANPDQEEQLVQLQQELDSVNTQLSNLDEDLSQQNEVLVTLEAAMATTLSNDETAAGGIAVLGDGLTALQGDFNDASVRLDTFGGEVDELTGDVAALDETAVTAQAMASDSETAVNDMAQTLMFFRAWELVARARLRLLENNPGLAQADVAEADEILQSIVLILPADSTEAETVQTVQTRLALAADNLNLDTDLAGTDLETAWDELDTILTARLQPVIEELELGLDSAAETPAPQESETESDQTLTPEPTITTTPEVTTTPSP
jgi:chromosome segregation ATPase